MSGTESYTLVIPAWNAAENIADTLHSAWQQTIRPTEIILVDDGSTDETVNAARASGVPTRIHEQKNAGPGAATTAGFSLVNTPLVAALDSDDLWLPDKIERQLSTLQNAPNVSAVFTHYQNFSATPDNRITPAQAGWNRSTMLMRTDAAIKLGPIIDQPSMVGEMIDWLARAREHGHQLQMLPELLVLRRVRPGSLSDPSRLTRNSGYLAVAREALRRRKMGMSE